jgi:hypothetical protein
MLRKVVAGIVFMTLSACGGGLAVHDHTLPVDRGPAVAAADSATLMIFRPEGSGYIVTIMDARGAVLGQLGPHTWLRLTLPPGRYRLYSMTDAIDSTFTSLIDIEAVPGRVYYASVPTFYRLTAVAPRHAKRWPNRDAWLAMSREVELDASQLAVLDAELPLATRMRAIASAEKEFNRMNDGKKAEFILYADDGVAQ